MGAVIIGAGGHAQDLAWTGLKMLAHHEQAFKRTAGEMLIGINDPRTRREVAGQLESKGWQAWPASVHPKAHVGKFCELADGVAVGPFASLLTEVKLGRHTHVGAGSHLTRCQVGDWTTIAPGVTICGDVVIGNGCLIGAGATVKNLVRIGNNVTVGAGAVVVCDLPDGVTVKGVPARVTAKATP